ncbi:cephalotoxin-like protein [Dicentrarchus labrax]|uniref:EGF-like domain-containing protein n=1 Tax=Dicentrarchus labrax TaxID=13489 RepID=A0A8C4H5Z3_DICLA|nr:cephalotoxin-like protein [Dicentrarchus labrax]
MEVTRLLSLLASLTLILYWTTSLAQSHDLPSSDLSPAYRVKRDQPFENREKVKETFQAITDALSLVKDLSEVVDVLKKLSKFASVAPGAVGVIFSVVNMVLIFIPQHDPVLSAVNEGFAEVNRKLDSLSLQVSNLATDVEWFNYASVYSQDELRILSAWRKLNELRDNSMSAQTQEEKQRQAEIFINYYEYTGTEASVANLYHYLTVSSTSLSANLNQLLRKKFKCDIRQIGKYNFYFNTLLLRGIVLNKIYWKMIGLNPPYTEAKHAEMFKKVYQAQKSAFEFCIVNYEDYVKTVAQEKSTAISPDNKNDIAVKVKQELDNKYDWYNWVVLVYNTADDGYYTLNSLTKVHVGKVTVAVGNIQKADVVWKDEIMNAARRCFTNCDAKTTIDQCKIKDDIDISTGLGDEILTYPFTKFAKVAYSHSTSYTDFVELPAPLGKTLCGWSYELSVHSSRSIPVCNNPQCQNGGRCTRLADSNLSLCDCEDGYFGDHCENRMDTNEVQRILSQYPVPTIITPSVRLKMIQSKLEQVFNCVNTRCG